MVLRADQGKDAAASPVVAGRRVGAVAAGAARAAGPRALHRVMAAVSCGALLAGLGAAAPAAVAAGAVTADRAAVPGSQLWASRYDGLAGRGGSAFAEALSPDGATLFVSGGSFGSVSGDYGTVAYDTANGAQRWASRYSGPGSGTDYATSVAVSPDGATVFVTGHSPGGASGTDYATVAYDAATGAQRWASRYNGPAHGDDLAYSLDVSPGGATVFVTGLSKGTPGWDYATIAYNAATGARRWASRAPANRDNRTSSLAVSPDGTTVFVTGTSKGASNLDYATIAYNAATGAPRWTRRYNGRANGEDSALSVAVSPGGATVLVTGFSRGATSGLDYATVAYNAATGAQRWVSRYNGPKNGDDYAVSVAAGPGGRTVFVTGTSTGRGTGFDYATIAYNAATGAPRWTRRYNGPVVDGGDFAASVKVSPGGTAVFVTGNSGSDSESDPASDYATVGYNAVTGARLWASLYTGPAGQSHAEGLAVSPDGTKVFVTGYTAGATLPFEYATIAYQH
jgi:WD40 repeat protein